MQYCCIKKNRALDFTSITSHLHNWVLFLLWLCLFISGVTSPLISCSILGTYWPGEFIFNVISFWLFILFMRFSRQEYWSGLSFPSPVGHVLSELSTRTCPSWVDVHSTAQSFIELDKAVIHVISLLVFCDCGFHSVGPLMDKGKRLMQASLWEKLTEWETGSCSDGWGYAQQIFNPIFYWWARLCSLPDVWIEAKLW